MRIPMHWMEKRVKGCRNKGIFYEYSAAFLFGKGTTHETEEETRKSLGHWNLFQSTL